MAALSSLGDYADNSDSEVEDTPDIEAFHLHLQPVDNSKAGVIVPKPDASSLAPIVAVKEEIGGGTIVDPSTKELDFNPKFDELFLPSVGPRNPFKTDNELAAKNTITGHVEESHLSEFQFETQRRTFHSYGYAIDPSADVADPSEKLVGSALESEDRQGQTVFEVTPKSRGDKRKKEVNRDPGDIDGYLGPWAKYADEQTTMKPSEEEQKDLDVILAKRAKKTDRPCDEKEDETCNVHIKDTHDYQGRPFTHAPHDVGVNLRSDDPPEKCFIPKKQIHQWKGHSKGVAAIRWFPKTAHLLLSSSMDTKIKIWEVYNDRRCIQTYLGHRQAVRDVCFNNDGSQFLSASYDRYVKLWDTETGNCVSRFSNRKVPYCVKFHPDEERHHLIVAGTSDKKIVCWDTRSGEITQEYDRHLGAVNTITFIDGNRRFVTSSDDKSIRLWEWDIPVDFKYIADPEMHSMPAMALSRSGKWLAAQSMDNKIVIFNALCRMKMMRKKVFKGHMVAGYACAPDFSPDMSYLVSGDADGKVYVWDFKTCKLFSKWKAHEDVCIQVLWHPHETSKLASAGWDGMINYWD